MNANVWTSARSDSLENCSLCTSGCVSNIFSFLTHRRVMRLKTNKVRKLRKVKRGVAMGIFISVV